MKTKVDVQKESRVARAEAVVETPPVRKPGRPRKMTVYGNTDLYDDDKRSMYCDICDAVHNYLCEQGVIPPSASIPEFMGYSVHAMLDMLEKYDNTISVLGMVMDSMFTQRHNLNVMMVAKFGIVTNGDGIKLNMRLLRELITNGQGELDIADGENPDWHKY